MVNRGEKWTKVAKSEKMSGFEKVTDLAPETMGQIPFLTRNGILVLHKGVETHIQARVIEVRRND